MDSRRLVDIRRKIAVEDMLATAAPPPLALRRDHRTPNHKAMVHMNVNQYMDSSKRHKLWRGLVLVRHCPPSL